MIPSMDLLPSIFVVPSIRISLIEDDTWESNIRMSIETDSSCKMTDNSSAPSIHIPNSLTVRCLIKLVIDCRTIIEFLLIQIREDLKRDYYHSFHQPLSLYLMNEFLW